MKLLSLLVILVCAHTYVLQQEIEDFTGTSTADEP